MSKHQFLLKTLAKYATFQSTGCPYCNCDRTTILQWKNRIWQLRRCDECSLNFRYPKDDPRENLGFYQKNYQQENVTDLPREEDMPFHISRSLQERWTGSHYAS
jgi:ribosomal protein L37AE/L43A